MVECAASLGSAWYVLGCHTCCAHVMCVCWTVHVVLHILNQYVCDFLRILHVQLC